MPREDGIYQGEWTAEFSQHYCEVWDELEAQGKLAFDAAGMADNRAILRRVRYTLQQRHGFAEPFG